MGEIVKKSEAKVILVYFYILKTTKWQSELSI